MAREAALKLLLESLFSAAELRNFLARLDPTLIAEIPEEGVTPAVLTSASVGVLCRYGLLGPDFFESLAAARPRRADEVHRIMAQWSEATEGEAESALMRSRRTYPQRHPTLPQRVEPSGEPILPRVEHPYQGRICEGAALERSVASTPSCVVVTGSAGMGKSTLALRVLHADCVATRFGRNRRFVRLDNAKSALEVVRALVQAMELPPDSDWSDLSWAIARAGTSLLVLDNLEAPWEHDAEGMEALLAWMCEFPSLALILTVRGRLPPGGLTLAQVIHLNPLLPQESKNLFLSISSEHDTSRDLDRLLERTSHVPLAVVLLAKVALGNDLTNLLRAWDLHQTDVLAINVGSQDRRHSWKVSIELSWSSKRMTEPGRCLASMCAALPGGISIRDIESLGGDDGPVAATCLIHVGLAYFEAGRMRMLAPIREHIARHHPLSLVEAARITTCYGRLVTRYKESGHTNFRSRATLEIVAELNNIDVAIQIGLVGDDPHLWISAALDLGNVVKFHQCPEFDSFAAALSAARRLQSPKEIIRCLTTIGWIAIAQHRWDDADQAYSKASALATIEDYSTRAMCGIGLGRVAIARGDNSEAGNHLNASLQLCRAGECVLLEAHCVANLALLAQKRGEFEAAVTRYSEALSLYQSLGPLPGEGHCLESIAALELQNGRPDAAGQALRRAIQAYRALGLFRGMARCMRGVGDMALRGGQPAEARRHYEEALKLFNEIRSSRGAAVCLSRLEACDAHE